MPGERNLLQGCIMAPRDWRQRCSNRCGAISFDGCRVPRAEHRTSRFRGHEKGRSDSRADVEPRRYCGNLNDPSRGHELFDSDVREADMPNKPLLAKLRQGRDLRLERDVVGVAAVQVIEIDALD